MRLWLRLTLLLIALTLVPVALTGTFAVTAATENAQLRPQEAMSRQASNLATFVGSWVDAQAELVAWGPRVWEAKDRSENFRQNLLRATYRAVGAAVSVSMVDGRGQEVVPPVYMDDARVEDGRTAGSAARSAALMQHLPSRIGATGYGIGRPYRPPGGGVAVAPIAATFPDGDLRIVAEVALDPLEQVFRGQPDGTAVLLDGYGEPVLGGVLPSDLDLDAILDVGIDAPFRTEVDGEPAQGAVWSVPYTDWKVLVLAPPAVSARAAAAIRGQTLRMAVLMLLVVLAVGWSMERTVTRAVMALREHASRVTDGGYTERNLVDRSDEIGDLAQALNVMSDRLEEHQSELDAFHRELQDRVEARTSELREAQEQLVHAGQLAAVAELGAGMAHELNNPLAAILGQVQLARASGREDDALLARVEEQAERCREVVAAMVRLSSGRIDASDQLPVDVAAVVRDAAAEARDELALRGIGLDLDLSEEPCAVRIDPVVAARVVTQLLDVLRAGLGEGARVRLSLVPGPPVELRVTPDRVPADTDRADDVRAAGLRQWGARGLMDLAGGRVLPPTDDDTTWRVVFPEDA